MKTGTIGIAAIIIGLCLLFYTGFNYVTTKRVVDLGPIKINKEENHNVQWPPLVGLVVLVAGVVIILNNKKIQT